MKRIMKCSLGLFFVSSGLLFSTDIEKLSKDIESIHQKIKALDKRGLGQKVVIELRQDVDKLAQKVSYMERFTPDSELLDAIEKNNVGLVSKIVKNKFTGKAVNGADDGIIFGVDNRRQTTFLIEAVLAGAHLDIIKLLAENMSDENINQEVIEASSAKKAAGYHGKTALHIAKDKKRDDVVQYLEQRLKQELKEMNKE